MAPNEYLGKFKKVISDYSDKVYSYNLDEVCTNKIRNYYEKYLSKLNLEKRQNNLYLKRTVLKKDKTYSVTYS